MSSGVILASAERRAVGVTFFVNGTVFGTFASRLPWIADRLHLSSGTLGLVGLSTSIGALATMPFAAQFVHRYGPKATTRVLIVASSGALVLPAVAPDLLVLTAMMLIFGALTGINDNAMNAQAVEAEQRIGKSIMSGLHGMWSLGVLAGALIGSLSARAHLDPVIQFAIVAVASAAAGGVAGVWFAGQAPVGAAAEIDVPRFAWPRGTILLIGLVGFASIFVEFAANDWSAVFMHWDLHSSQAAAAIATGAFAGSMATGRLCGDAAVRRFGPVLSVRACGVLGTAGCVLVATSPAAVTALIGFILIGLGVSVVVPLVFAAAGRSGPSPAIGVAGVATVSYGAGMAAPSVMGGVADISSLRIAFAVAALFTIGIGAGAGLLGRERLDAHEPAAATSGGRG
ncbi:MAG TPA: MFS transporter [Streptosporangiaceae bacterium]|nr:MFS transporter [Streptosporangiaceae bacterium]